MAILVRNNFKSITYGDQGVIAPGSCGRGDISSPWKVETAPIDANGLQQVLYNAGAAGGHEPYIKFNMQYGWPFVTPAPMRFKYRMARRPMIEPTPLRQYSISFIQTRGNESTPLPGEDNIMFRVYNNDTTVYGIILSPTVADGGNFEYLQSQRPGICNASNTLIGTAYPGQYDNKQIYSGMRLKWEFEANEDAAVKLKVRIYRESVAGANDWYPYHSMEANPTTVIANEFAWGHFTDQASKQPITRTLQHIYCWDNAAADGLFPNANTHSYGVPTYAYWNGSTEVSVNLENFWTGSTYVNPKTATENEAFNGFQQRREISKPPRNVTSEQFYSSGSGANWGTVANESYFLFTPTGTAPSGGWPVIMFTHCNFFIAGTALDMFIDHYQYLLDNWLRMGWAVCSVGVKNAKGDLEDGNPATAPSFTLNTAIHGVYPQQILGVKLAARHMMDRHATNGINPNRVVTGGHSGGGHMGSGAALTRDFVGSTMSFRLKDYGLDSRDDPKFMGAYNINSPIDLNYVRENDMFYPDWGLLYIDAGSILINTTVGRLRPVMAWIRGIDDRTATPDMSDCNLAGYVSDNAVKCPPIFGATSESDMVIWEESEAQMQAACAANNIPYTRFYHQGATHEGSITEFPHYTFGRWLNSLTPVLGTYVEAP